MRQIFYILTLGLFALTACSQKAATITTDEQTLSFPSEEEARKVLVGDQITCEGECPENVASFMMYHSKVETEDSVAHKITQCSATLIANDQILTNYHCIDGILKEGDVLDPKKDDVYIEIKFPKTKNLPYESVKGIKVLKASKNYVRFIAPDFAIIKLEKSMAKRKPVTVSEDKLADKMPVQLFPVYFDVTTVPTSGVIRQVKCTQSFDNFADIFSVDKESPLFVIENCNYALVHGNSGTGVFNEAGSKLVGLMSGNATKANAVRGTLAHCLPNFASLNDECFFSDDNQFTEIYKQLNILYSFTRDLALFEMDTAPYVGFEFERTDFPEKPKLEFNELWKDDLAYLDKPESQELKDKYTYLYTKLFFSFRPTCIKKEFLEDPLYLPLFGLSEADFRPYVWTEKIAPNNQQASISYQTPTLSAGVKNVPVKLTLSANKKKVLIEADSELPMPISKFSFSVPLCE